MTTRALSAASRGEGLPLVFLLLALIGLLPGTSRAQVAEWTFENISSAVPGLPIAASFSLPQVSASANLAGGNNNGSPDACSGNEAWSTNFWPTGTVRNPGEYLEFSVRPDPGESISINSFSFSSNASSANSATQFEVYYSKNNFRTASFLFSGNQSTGSCTVHSGSLSTTLLPGTTIRFRIYPFGQNIAAQAATIRLDNVAVGGSLLPVELTEFYARAEDERVDLFWTTATEVNNDYFTVERSADGIAYTTIGQVPGSGNSAVEQHYHFRDEQPLTGTNYYRLRQFDYDGSAHVHRTIAIEKSGLSSGQVLTIWPTAVRHQLHVQIDDHYGAGTLTLVNAAGQVIRSWVPAPAASRQDLLVDQLPEGWYLLSYRSQREHHTRRFFKQ